MIATEAVLRFVIGKMFAQITQVKKPVDVLRSR